MSKNQVTFKITIKGTEADHITSDHILQIKHNLLDAVVNHVENSEAGLMGNLDDYEGFTKEVTIESLDEPTIPEANFTFWGTPHFNGN